MWQQILIGKETNKGLISLYVVRLLKNIKCRATLGTHLLRVRERIQYLTSLKRKRLSSSLGKIASRVLHKQDISKGDESSDPLVAVQYWKDIESAIVAYITSVSASNDFRPFYVLGFPAKYETTIAILSSLISFYIALVSAYFQSSATDSSSGSSTG